MTLEMKEVGLRVSVCIAVVMLSMDLFNPVKVLSSLFGFDPAWFAAAALVAFLLVLIGNTKELIYSSVKVFLVSIMSIFFASVDILGKQNIPEHGPIIFSCNHMNQFVDAAIIVISNPHRVGFLIAEKSYNTRIVGDIAKAIGCIPVSRPQDSAVKGVGRIMFDGLRLLGDGTKFSELNAGDKILPGRVPEAYKIREVISDSEALLGEEAGEPSPLNAKVCQGVWVEYAVLRFIDQSHMFEAVKSALSKGQCLGIFPEGGSHDNTDLLPLKVGVAAIALGVLEKYGINVPIVPVGLNYFRGHRFRGRVVVEFGQPIYMNKELFSTFKDSKRKAYQALLTQVEEGMRSVIVTATDYAELKLMHTVRRLYQHSDMTPGPAYTKKKQDLMRRMSVGYRSFCEKCGGSMGLPDDLRRLQAKVEAYQRELDLWGLKDYQINNLEISYKKSLYTFAHGFMVLLLAMLPTLLLNAPVGLAARYWASKQREKDLKNSRVKLFGRDVLLSKKITFCLVAVPTLWVLYAVLLLLFSNLRRRVILLLFLCFPFFSYLGVVAAQAGMVDIKDLRPAFLQLLPAFREKAKVLPYTRAELQQEVRAMIKKYGPEFGSLYFDKTSEWEKDFIKKSNSMKMLSE